MYQNELINEENYSDMKKLLLKEDKRFFKLQTYILTTVSEFSIKAYQDFYHIYNKHRIIDWKFLVKMLISEYFEYRFVFCIKNNINFENVESSYYSFSNIFNIIFKELFKNFENVEEFKLMFELIHKQNMLKIFKDGYFHFDINNCNKVIKPNNWNNVISKL